MGCKAFIHELQTSENDRGSEVKARSASFPKFRANKIIFLQYIRAASSTLDERMDLLKLCRNFVKTEN